jgi:hypothetical protein
MRTIPVETYPLKKTYKTAEAAIEGAKNNPLQPMARADSDRLTGTSVVDACWTDTDFVIRFSNERFLHIWTCLEEVQWEVLECPPVLNKNEVQRVGAEPVVYCWQRLGDRVHDSSALTAKRRGAEFQRLFVNEGGLLVYLRGHLIWHFAAIRRTDLDQPILLVDEMD